MTSEFPTIRASEVPDTAEPYEFLYAGAPFAVLCAPDGVTTMAPPNVRVTKGSWPTWRIDVDNNPGVAGVRLMRCANADGTPHANGNVPEDAAGPGELSLVVAAEGRMFSIPIGYAVVARLYTQDEWTAQLAEWAARLPDTADAPQPIKFGTI